MTDYVISREDLLLRLSKLKAENALLRSQAVGEGKLKSYISELEDTIQKHKNKKLQDSIIGFEDATNKVKEQQNTIDQLKRSAQKYKDRINNLKAIIIELRAKNKTL